MPTGGGQQPIVVMQRPAPRSRDSDILFCGELPQPCTGDGEEADGRHHQPRAYEAWSAQRRHDQGSISGCLGGGQLFGQGLGGLGGGDLRCCSAAALRVCLLLLEEEEILLERPNGSVSAGRNAARRWKCESFSSGRNSFGRSLTYRVVCPGYCMPTRSKVSDQRLSIQAG